MSNLIISGTTPTGCGCCGGGAGLVCDPFMLTTGSHDEAVALLALYGNCYALTKWHTIASSDATPDQPCFGTTEAEASGSFLTGCTTTDVTASVSKSASADCENQVALSFGFRCKVAAGTTISVSAELTAAGTSGDTDCGVTATCGAVDLIDEEDFTEVAVDGSFVVAEDCCFELLATCSAVGSSGAPASCAMDITINFTAPVTLSPAQVTYSTPSPGVLTCTP